MLQKIVRMLSNTRVACAEGKHDASSWHHCGAKCDANATEMGITYVPVLETTQ